MNNYKYWKLVAIIELIVIIALIVYYSFVSLKGPVQQRSFFPDKLNQKYGKCRAKLPIPVIDSNYIRVDATLKGKLLSISEFEWNDSNYSHPGCFRLNPDQTEHTLSNYMSRAKQDSLIPFYIKIRTRSNDNDYEFSLKVFNLKNQLIGKYPATGESVKAKIDFIGNAVLLTENIKLKN